MAAESIPESMYMLNSGSSQVEHDRLNVQHHLFNDIMQGHLLPPHIISALDAQPTPPKILEMATGSAIWLTEVAKTLPAEAELVGLDYDTSRFPPPSSLPPNIKLGKGDMYEPFSSDLLGNFDVVHVRMILFGVKEGRGPEVARNLLTLLKPGGYLVWVETGPVLLHGLVTTIEPPSLAWFKFQQASWRFAKKVGSDLNLPNATLSYIKEVGCIECDDKAYPGSAVLYTDKGKDWIAQTNSNFTAFFEPTLRGIVSLGGVEGLTTDADVDEVIALADQEFGNRKIHYMLLRAWGKKPATS
ncbi:hypothetical protein F5B22DRAFT_659718 [Xylaria bambusicola]|uniref:uncharacterized protein n=1 Tax=Xylaria bambusicola TaxID=326684 RepID=UPI002007D852|nr:uncharacterized protein F5B22DRAFT_659718 [Xylaria bambusicola]KAI0508254.1 hypothetical protein F5B22DRAFT_659718 [Xylaria bambusicola]